MNSTFPHFSRHAATVAATASCIAAGFFPAYTVGCLVLAFGRPGILAALGILGLRCLVTVPVFFLLAVPSWRVSAGLFRVSFGRGHPFSPVYDRQWWARFLGACLVLGLGICLDLGLSPRLIQLLLKQIL